MKIVTFLTGQSLSGIVFHTDLTHTFVWSMLFMSIFLQDVGIYPRSPSCWEIFILIKSKLLYFSLFTNKKNRLWNTKVFAKETLQWRVHCFPLSISIAYNIHEVVYLRLFFADILNWNTFGLPNFTLPKKNEC